jgi:hypothetical protein
MTNHSSLPRPDQLAGCILRKEPRIAELLSEVKDLLKGSQ